MKAKSHKILDHPILGYFILFIFALIFSNLGSTIDGLVAPFIPGYSTEIVTPAGTATSALGFGSAIGALVAILIYMLWFRPDFQDILSGKGSFDDASGAYYPLCWQHCQHYNLRDLKHTCGVS